MFTSHSTPPIIIKLLFIENSKNLFDKKFPSPEPIINKNGNYISEILNKKAAVVSFLTGNSKKVLSPNDC